LSAIEISAAADVECPWWRDDAGDQEEVEATWPFSIRSLMTWSI
jgi:hypothetical protein